MALQLSNFVCRGQPIPSAYLRVIFVSITRADTFNATADTITVSYEIYFNQAARIANEPLQPGQVSFADSSASAALTQTFKSAQSTSEAALSPMDLLITKAYSGLLNHPETSAMLAGATRV